MICYYVMKFKNKIQKTLESNKYTKLNTFHFKIINDYSTNLLNSTRNLNEIIKQSK